MRRFPEFRVHWIVTVAVVSVPGDTAKGAAVVPFLVVVEAVAQ